MSKTAEPTKSTKPPSARRLAANRDNAARSTGPITPEGKTRSAQNARKHGFTASKFAVVRLEELDSLANLRADAIAVYQPVNSQELFAVERIALAQLSLLRCASLEAGFFTSALNETIAPHGAPHNLLNDQLVGDIQVTRAQNCSLCLAVGFDRLYGKSDAWKLFLRYQSQTERLYRRAVDPHHGALLPHPAALPARVGHALRAATKGSGFLEARKTHAVKRRRVPAGLA